MKKSQQYVFEGTWDVAVDATGEPVTQLFCGKDFRAAFLKSRTWAETNCPNGELVKFEKKEGMVI
jgi:hypothetical protein